MRRLPEVGDLLAGLRRRGAEYADLRAVRRRTEQVRTKNGASDVAESTSCGWGLRVLCEGAWGFASSGRLDPEELARLGDEALAIARASARPGGSRAELAPADAVDAVWKTPYRRDPFETALEEKVGLLLEADRRIRSEGEVRVAEGNLLSQVEEKDFWNTEGSCISQTITECGGGITALAAAGGEVQRRGYPNAHRGHFATGGWEFVAGLDLVENAERVGKEAAELLRAEQCPTGTRTVILDGRQLALQIHESCGHPCELDRVLGSEAAYAGTSFLDPGKLGTFQYGSGEVTLVADATLEGGLGTYGYDDEGIPAQRAVLVDRGTFCGYLTSRETAARVGLGASNGAMRADGWNRLPLVRMTNVNLEPGDWDLEELIRDTGDGLFLEINKSWSIDDRRLNFQFATEAGWEIKDGSLGRLIRNATYTGITPEFWGSCDAVTRARHWQLWGTPNCGKGQPGQVAHVGHGASPARFRNVRVGVGKW